jgi:hypothetical protein
MLQSLEFSYSAIEYNLMQALENAFRENGARKPVLIAFDDQATVFDKDHFLIYGTMKKSFMTRHISYNLFNGSMEIRELG